jgi:hypothetical protein
MRPHLKANLFGAWSLFLRYVGGIVVAYLVSFGSFIMVGMMALPFETRNGWNLFWLPPFVAGFLGVLCGALITPRDSRKVASLLFLGLGLGMYCYMWRRLNYERPEYPTKEYPHLIPLACGGIIAVGVHWISRRVDLGRFY